MIVREFALATRVVTGLGARRRLGREISGFSATKVILIADRGVHEAGLVAEIADGIPDSLVRGVALVDPDPDIAAVGQALADARELGGEVVVGIGGGSALSVAKAVSVGLTHVERIDSFEGVDRVPRASAPMIAVPTTAGSGSEVSPVLVLHERGRDRELAVRSPYVAPNVAVLDGELLRGLPRAPLIYAAIDALSHCLDSNWSRGATQFTRALSSRAADTILESLPRAVEGVESGANQAGLNDGVLQDLIEASCAANIACGNSGLALVHALSTAPSIRLPHGRQNGILLPLVAAFNHAASSAETRELVTRIARLYAHIDFDPSFPPRTIGTSEIEAMITASRGHPFRHNNIRSAGDDELYRMLSTAPGVEI